MNSIANRKILAFHLFNDYSGSPKVLRLTLEGLAQAGYTIDLFTSRGGVLDDLPRYGVKLHYFHYHFSPSIIATFARIVWAELCMFFYGLKYGKRDSIFFINTIMPLGGALAGKLLGAKVVYHYHENAFIKSRYYRWKAKWMQKIADKIICVSDFQKSFLQRTTGVSVIPNALPTAMRRRFTPDPEEAFKRKNVMLVGSLKGYKGIREFFSLACKLPDYTFTLVINDTQDAIAKYIDTNSLSVSDNLEIYARQKDIVPFYNKASVIVNLSNKKFVLETFGLTAIEGMAAGIPAIVPTEGGIAELIEDGVNGYRIDAENMPKIIEKINLLFSDKQLYLRLCRNASIESKKYAEETMISSLIHLFSFEDEPTDRISA